MTRTDDNLARFIAGYAEAMIWANTTGYVQVDGAEELESDTPEPSWWQTPSATWQLEAFDADAQHEIRAECRDFVGANMRDLIAYVAAGRGWDYAGHDFALTRNHHGAGFWDRGLGDLGDRLTDAAHVYGESSAWYDASEDAEDMEVHLNQLTLTVADYAAALGYDIEIHLVPATRAESETTA